MPTPISPSTFTSLLARYVTTHHHRHANKPAPDNICDCAFRFTTAPALVASRRQRNSGSGSGHAGGHLEVDELARLVEWKIHHGSFFPSLPKLARANDAESVRAVTGEAFALLAASTAEAEAERERQPDDRAVMAALNTLTRLKGVGPATASLLLSVAEDGASVPFFADEVFLWASVAFDGVQLPGKKSVKIKYSAKEYEGLLRDTRAFLSRMRGQREGEGGTVTAKDVEMVARVLGAVGKDGVKGEKPKVGGVDARTPGDEDSKALKKVEDDEQPVGQPTQPKKRKRAVAKAKPSDAADDTKASATGRRVMPRRAARQT